MAKKLPSDRVTIAVFEKSTGLIKQVVRCKREDAESQHKAWPGHHFQDVTNDDVESPHPRDHMVCLKTGKLLPRVAPLDEVRREKHRLLHLEHRDHLARFTSSATGQPLEYSGDPARLIAMTHAAIIGGDLAVVDHHEETGVSYVEHTADQARAVMSDFAKHSRAGRVYIGAAKDKLAKAKTTADMEKIQWGKK